MAVKTAAAPKMEEPQPQMPRVDSSAYWLADGWDPEAEISTTDDEMFFHEVDLPLPQKGCAPRKAPAMDVPLIAAVDAVGKVQGMPTCPTFALGGLKSVPVCAYPIVQRLPSKEGRIYVGAEAGLSNHLVAVQPKESEKQPSPQKAASSTTSPSLEPSKPQPLLQAPALDVARQLSSSTSATQEVPHELGHTGDDDDARSEASDGYWGAEGWDPEERIYVGAACGQQNHLKAVRPKAKAGPLE